MSETYDCQADLYRDTAENINKELRVSSSIIEDNAAKARL